MSIQTPIVADFRDTISHHRRGMRLLLAVLTAVACLVLAAHVDVGLASPFWLDEAGTGAFASLPSLPDLLSAIRDDSNAPFYYVSIWGWAKLFGASDLSLRLPGLILSCLAPLAAWLGLRASRPHLAPVWAAAVALWGPGIAQSGYARCYPLLLLAVVLSCVSFVRLLDAPRRGRVLAWAACGVLVILTHYDGALLVGLQGAIWLALHRRDAVRHWPAGFVFVPAVGWILWHLPRLLPYARPDIAWYHTLSLREVWGAAASLIGIPPSWLPAALAMLLLIELSIQRSRVTRAIRCDTSVTITGAAALGAAVLFVGLGVLKPLYASRYLSAFAPGVQLLISGRLVAASRGHADLRAVLIGGYAALATTFWFGQSLFQERMFSFEAASAWVARSEPRRLVYFWDNPATLATSERILNLFGGYFLRRDGLPVEVVPVVLRPGTDMNGSLLAVTGTATAVLWLSDINIRDTSARRYPPRLAEARPDLECRDFGAGPFGIYACRPQSSP